MLCKEISATTIQNNLRFNSYSHNLSWLKRSSPFTTTAPQKITDILENKIRIIKTRNLKNFDFKRRHKIFVQARGSKKHNFCN